MPRKRTSPDTPIVVPFSIVIDTREQQPYRFDLLRADAKDKYRPLHVPTVVRGLKSGDYSLLGHEEEIAVERKSLDDLFGTLGGGRERFVAELERLASMTYAAVIIEASWDGILLTPPERSRLKPKTVFRSVISWSQRYPSVHWFTMGSRRFGESATFRILERYWKETKKEKV